MIHIDYSKSSADIGIEVRLWGETEEQLLAEQRQVALHLREGSLRRLCLLCANSLASIPAYRHRSIDYALCGQCGHLQTSFKLPAGFPHAQRGKGFEGVYPKLDTAEYLSRRDRVYRPKLEWILTRLNDVGLSRRSALAASWLEVGCGAGYFLHALKAEGAQTIQGLDINATLVEQANSQCASEVAALSSSILEDLDDSSAEIIVAFFFLEHIDEAARLWQILGSKPPGTVLAFSVPTFGLSTVTEGGLHDFAARNLDNVIHTQLYTDRSIDYALQRSGYEKIAEWLFGQDAQDLCRLLINRITAHMEPRMARETALQLSALVDPIQQIVDRARLCDARHVLAVKR